MNDTSSIIVLLNFVIHFYVKIILLNAQWCYNF